MASEMEELMRQLQCGQPTPAAATTVSPAIIDPFEESVITGIDFRAAQQPERFVKLCIICRIRMSARQGEHGAYYECPACGEIDEDCAEDIDSIEAISSYNTSETSAAPIRICGPGNKAYQRDLLSHTSSSKKAKKNSTVDQMTRCVYQYKGSPLPHHVVIEAADFYYQDVQQHCILRGNVRKGTMAACLYRICRRHGITRKPKEIADVFEIDQSDFSNGDKILDDLESRGLIQSKHLVPSDETIIIESFLNRYFNELGLPGAEPVLGEERTIPKSNINYYDFARRLVKFTADHHIAKGSVLSTKCAGAVYIVTAIRREFSVTRSQIENICHICKSTFGRFAQNVYAVLRDPAESPTSRELRRLFEEYGLLPSEKKII